MLEVLLEEVIHQSVNQQAFLELIYYTNIIGKNCAG